mmetsp:Transcript_20029/g.29275  ORF Transcript_20029/g.29275 Transcript_20029/m.29275 type:complete len:206 (+) Transcript_20029:288-905(+)
MEPYIRLGRFIVTIKPLTTKGISLSNFVRKSNHLSILITIFLNDSCHSRGTKVSIDSFRQGIQESIDVVLPLCDQAYLVFDDTAKVGQGGVWSRLITVNGLLLDVEMLRIGLFQGPLASPRQRPNPFIDGGDIGDVQQCMRSGVPLSRPLCGTHGTQGCFLSLIFGYGCACALFVVGGEHGIRMFDHEEWFGVEGEIGAEYGCHG